MARILVVEDESAIAELIAINLRHAGHELTVAADAQQAQFEVDAVLPGPGGARLDVARPIRPGAGAPMAQRSQDTLDADHHAYRPV